MPGCPLTVITPSLNQAAYLERTIASVLEQGIEDLDYRIYDGGSTDGTQQILDRHAASLVAQSEPDRGQAHAVNKGLAEARGEIIGWLNSDDVYAPGALAAVLEAFERHPEADVLYGDAEHIDEQDRTLGPYPTEDWDPARLAEECILCCPAVFVRRRALERFGPLDESLHYCMDYEWWLRLAAGGARFVRLRRVLAGTRVHAGTKTFGTPLVHHREVMAMLKARSGRVPDTQLRHYAHLLVSARGVRSVLARRLLKAPVALWVAARINRTLPWSMLCWQIGWLFGRHRREHLHLH